MLLQGSRLPDQIFKNSVMQGNSAISQLSLKQPSENQGSVLFAELNRLEKELI